MAAGDPAGAAGAGLPPAGPLEIRGIPVACRDTGGDGPPALCIHESASSSLVWEPLARELWGRARIVAYDRRGWGESGAPEGYRETTVAEHAEDATELLGALGLEEALVCGAGFGAVVALDLMLRDDSSVAAGVLIEPPLISLLPEMPEGLSEDRQLIAAAVAEGGPAAAADLYAAGGLAHLGPGASRLPAEVAASAGSRPVSLFAELAAVAAWELRGMEMLSLTTPSWIVVGDSTPPVLRRAADHLAARLGGSALLDLAGEGLPHVTAAAGLAAAIGSLG